MFQDSQEGKTHSYNDGCGMPEHNQPKEQDCNCDTSRPMTKGEAELAKMLDEAFELKEQVDE